MRHHKRHCDVKRDYRRVGGEREIEAQKSPTARRRKNRAIGFGSAPSGRDARDIRITTDR